jgi:hypothetical protein
LEEQGSEFELQNPPKVRGERQRRRNSVGKKKSSIQLEVKIKI